MNAIEHMHKSFKACSKRFSNCIIGVLGVFYILGHATLSAQAVKTVPIVFNYTEYLNIVKEHHPVATVAELQLKRGDATVLRARGAFDPKVFTDALQKYFNGTDYFSLIDGGLKIPTWFGVELKGAYEQNRGVFMNPENTVPSAGLWYAGISLPLLQGMFIDERRASLRKAQIFQKSTEAERQIILNDLFLEASMAYWSWFASFNRVGVITAALDLAQQRFEFVKLGAVLGDRPFIDTLEAGIQVQQRQLSLQQANVELANSRALLNVYLWADGVVPLELSEEVVPEDAQGMLGLAASELVKMQIDSLIAQHPFLLQTQYKLEQLEIDRRMSVEQLKPRLNLNYNPLSSTLNGNDIWSNYSINNYKWGMGLSMPLFYRKERGQLKLANIQINETELAFQSKNAELEFKAIASINEWNTTSEQVNLSARLVADQLRLLQGERQMFEAGESSLFMLNARETSYIGAQVELYNFIAKNRIAPIKTRHALGTLYAQ